MKAVLVANPDIYRLIPEIAADPGGAIESWPPKALDTARHRGGLLFLNAFGVVMTVNVQVEKYDASGNPMGTEVYTTELNGGPGSVIDLASLQVTDGPRAGAVILPPKLKLTFTFSAPDPSTQPEQALIHLHLTT